MYLRKRFRILFNWNEEKGFWCTNLEQLAFLDLMILSINFYTLLDHDTPEF